MGRGFPKPCGAMDGGARAEQGRPEACLGNPLPIASRYKNQIPQAKKQN